MVAISSPDISHWNITLRRAREPVMIAGDLTSRQSSQALRSGRWSVADIRITGTGLARLFLIAVIFDMAPMNSGRKLLPHW